VSGNFGLAPDNAGISCTATAIQSRMLRLWLCILWMAAAAAAQSPVQTGYSPVVAYEAITPETATVNISNSPTGATNATGNNLAGARNSTIGNVPGLSYGSISVPVYLQPFPTVASVPQDSELTAATASSRLPGITGSIHSPSAYSLMADPLAAAARDLRGTQQRIATRIYTNADLLRLKQQFDQTASLTVSTVRTSADAVTEAAQAMHDRNLGFQMGTLPQPPISVVH
jgi:hypothetical protein